MLLTVLTPTFNCAQSLCGTLNSVGELEKKFPGKIQHLIGDAGSSDGSLEIISKYVESVGWANFFLVKGLNIPETLNQLFPHACGRWVVVLNGDDCFEVGVLSAILEEKFLRTPSILCGQVSVFSVDGHKRGVRGCRLDQLERHMSVNHPAMLVDRQVFETVGMFDVSAPTAYDYVWVWRAHQKKVPFVVYPVVFAQVRLGGISQSKASQAAWEILKTKIKAGCVVSAVCNYGVFLFKLYVRKLLPLWLSTTITKRYRKSKGSIEHY